MRLWELTDELRNLQQAVETVERPEELQPFLDCLAECREETISKVDGIACLINDLEHRAEAAEAERQRLSKVQRHYQNNADRLREYVQGCLQAANIERVSGPRFAVSVCRCPPSVQVIDENKVPVEFIRRHTETSIDKAGILELWREGVFLDIPGVKIVDDKKRLAIK